MIEQTVLLDAATVYMDVVRDAAVLEVQRSNVRMLDETLRQTRGRFQQAEVTRTDVAQAEAQLAAGQSQMLRADADLATSKARYRRVIGSKPGRLEPGLPVDRLSPRTLAGAIDAGMMANPSVMAATYGVDVARLQVKISEGALYPTVTLLGNVQRGHDISPGVIPEQYSATALVGVTIPLYQGGAEYSTIRQSKETLAQRRLELATTRDQARATVVQVWSELQAAKAQIQAAQEQVRASEVALNGMRMEARLGMRTTFDVLHAQQVLVEARLSLVAAQHDRIVGSYNLLSAVGRLSPQTLGLPTSIYDPMVHYQQVRDAWTRYPHLRRAVAYAECRISMSRRLGRPAIKRRRDANEETLPNAAVSDLAATAHRADLPQPLQLLSSTSECRDPKAVPRAGLRIKQRAQVPASGIPSH